MGQDNMPSMSAAAAFFGVAFLMAWSPGPNLIYLASRSLCQGRAAGFASLAGVCSGMFVYMLATAAGLSALFKTVPLAYEIVRWAGAAYLLWLAWKAFTRNSPLATPGTLPPQSRAILFRNGLLTCLLNPKIVITYGALLPLFADPASGHVARQIVVLGLVQILAAASAHSIVILSASAVASAVAQRPLFVRGQRWLLGSVLVSLAAWVALERRGTA